MVGPIRILQMIGSLNIGGSQAMIVSLYKAIDRTKVQFDFIIDRPGELHYADELKALGARIYELPTFNGFNLGEVVKAWYSFFKDHPEYKVLHSHIRSYASIYLPIARKYGLKTVIHSHATSNGKGFQSLVKAVLQFPLRFQADCFIGCSPRAGEWLFGKRVVQSNRFFTLNNGVDLQEYKFDAQKRQAVRSELGIGEEVVFGHVGRLHEAKNHMFLLDLFDGIHKRIPASKLVIVGDGDLYGSIKSKIGQTGLADSVILTGSRSDVPDLMMAFDCFLFPSLWEGLPVALVEAQASGLPCYISDTITGDVNISGNITYLPIDKGINVWCDSICNQTFKRNDVSMNIKNAGFDVNTTADWLMCLYLKLADGE